MTKLYLPPLYMAVPNAFLFVQGLETLSLRLERQAVRRGIQVKLKRYFVVALTILAAGVIVLWTGFNQTDSGSKQPVIKQDHSMHSTEK
ncbi:hypothetical protein P22_3201 [Propionispora sp. 2/2-37]|uniref:hypothetical protein n=1 Tax=Propionispora sp. 2/2-37 TaxID=1677858 RepID=UPI0006BB7AF5|nr:hypothetical protein [Propionispora sp. 2/2-37]CUH97075.1 hypothetical protein P22_3201 [Propionispora sp. 2/2-37]